MFRNILALFTLIPAGMNPHSDIGPLSVSAFCRRRIASRSVILGALMAIFCTATLLRASEPGLAGATAIEYRLQQRVNANPRDAAAWRLLGRLRIEQEDYAAAYVALARAVELAPASAAAHYDYGRVLLLMEMPVSATHHLKKAIELAPGSGYAADAAALLQQVSEPSSETFVKQAGFEVKRFDGSDLAEAFQEAERIERELAPSTVRSPLDFYLEAGLLYNSNVALTPLSRELSPDEPESFQLFAAPEIEYRVVNGEEWRAGPALGGYFNLNEDNHDNLNLRNYTPGFFVERRIDGDRAIYLARAQYDFTYEEFDGDTFGNRNALTLSGTAYWNRAHVSHAYWSADYTDFASDGVLPEITSRDGWTNTLGASHVFYPECWYLYSLRGGFSVQFADLEGTDFSYNGVNLFSEADVPLTQTVSLILEAGWGYRDYFDFEFSPSRNENIWRAGVELEKRFSDCLSAAAVFNYDRFDSKNLLFEAERFVTGLVMRFDY